MNKKKVVKRVSVIITILFILLVGYRVVSKQMQNHKKSAPAAMAANVTVDKVTTAMVGKTFTGSGNIAMNNAVTYTAQNGGTLKAIKVSNGEYVQKGTLLFVISSPSISASYESAVATVSSTKEALANAKFTYDRYQKLYASQLVAESDYLTQKNAYTAALNNYNAAVASLNSAQYNQSQLEIRSDISGYVSGITVTAINNQLSVGETLCTVSSSGTPTVTIGVTADDFYQLQKNSQTRIVVSVPSIGQTFNGTILSMNPSANSQSQLYDIKISIVGATNLFPGMYAEVNMMIGEANSLVVPTESVVLGSFGSYLYVVEQGKAKQITVTTGTTFNGKIAVSAPELSAGELVVTQGQFTLTNGEAVKVISTATTSGSATSTSGSSVAHSS